MTAGWKAIQSLTLGVGAFAMLLAAATNLLAHLALQSSQPAAGDTLLRVPREIVLTFTEDVDLPLSAVDLNGPAGPIALGPITGSTGSELRVGILGAMSAGVYTVDWQAVGPDGHPIRGEFGFEIAADAAGLPVAVASRELEADPIPPLPAGMEDDPSFSPLSPLYAAVRWANYLGIIASIGSVAFLMLLRRASAPGNPGSLQLFADAASRSSRRFGLLAVGLLAVSIVLRVQAQSHAVMGRGISRATLGPLLESDWGAAVVVQSAAALAIAVGLAVAWRSVSIGLPIAVVGGVLLATSPALSSHAASAPGLTSAAIISDSLHVLAAGTWLGSLLLFVAVGVPHLKRVDSADRGTVYARLLRNFSALALLSGGAIVATGLFAATLQLNGPADLLGTRYGLVLGAKLLLALSVFALGAFNWRQLPKRQDRADAVGVFRRRAGLELVIALLIVAATAILVAIPPPSHDESVVTMNPVQWPE